MARGWNQSGFLNGNINATLDPYYLCFLDENTPTVTRTNGLRTIDLSADLSAHLISGLETPCMLPTTPNDCIEARRDIPERTEARHSIERTVRKRHDRIIARNACRSQCLFGSCGAGYANLDCNGWRISKRHAGSLALHGINEHRSVYERRDLCDYIHLEKTARP